MVNPKGNPATLIPFKPGWKSGQTKTIRVPEQIAEQVLDAARKIDEGTGKVVEAAYLEMLCSLIEMNKAVLEQIRAAQVEDRKTLTRVVIGLRMILEEKQTRPRQKLEPLLRELEKLRDSL